MTITESEAQTVAVVTGAARGLGRLTAERLAQRGYNVLITDIDESVFETARILNSQTNNTVWGMLQDVREADSHRQISASAKEKGELTN